MVPKSTTLDAGGFFEGSVREAKEKGEKGEEMKLVRTRLVEQRVSHFAMGLLIMGCMSGPLLVVLYVMASFRSVFAFEDKMVDELSTHCSGLMSRAMFAGIFIVVGWGSVEGDGIVDKTLFLMRDADLTPRNHPLANVKKSSIFKFVAVQWLFFAATVAVSETFGRSPLLCPLLQKQMKLIRFREL